MVGVGVTIFLVMFVVPMFQEFFDRLERSGTGLPLITVILVATSQFLVRYGAVRRGGGRGPGRGAAQVDAHGHGTRPDATAGN